MMRPPPRDGAASAGPSRAAAQFAAAGAPPAAWSAIGARSPASKDPWARFGWLMAVIWLVFLIYPVLALLRSTAPVGWIIVGWVMLVAFIVLYVVGFMHGMRGGGGLGKAPSARQWITFAALIVCALLSVPAEGGSALSFLPFIMSFASYGLTRTWHWITTVGAVAVTALCVFLIPGGIEYLSLLAIVGLLGVVNTVSTWLIVRSVQAERLGLELATSEGREAVARDVHDLVGHSLTVVGLKAQLVRRLMESDPERAKAELADIEALTAEALAGVRASVAGARGATLVEQLAASRDALGSAGIDVQVEGAPGALSPVQSLTASWILREATTNALRHSRSRTVTVLIAPGSLAVEDDGVGSRAPEGNGIRGMRERAAAAGAVLRWSSAENSGTRVEVTW
ncbi:sensor histidine kinase [Microbacterium sp. LWH12-1.2]|uniref:sensor histidine kinase n=1 Tax=Microbacterium sp. LWH12-1.2 TaxID=3135259 RepID=UPI0034162581